MNANAILKGNRVRSARMLTRLTRKNFQEKYHIHENTLKSWENPTENKNGLTKKGALRFIETLKNENITCTLDWLLYGIGDGPRLTTQPIIENNTIVIPEISINQDEAILKEIQFFLDVNPDSVVALVSDNSMAPFFFVGDHVGGYKRKKEFIKYFVNVNCIVETTEGTQYICRYTTTEKENIYRIFYLNSLNNIDNNKMLVEIDSIAPIVWHRRKDDSFQW